MAEGELRDYPVGPGEDPDLEPLSPDEQERQRRTFSEGGYLTRETLILAMLEVDAGWA